MMKYFITIILLLMFPLAVTGQTVEGAKDFLGRYAEMYAPVTSKEVNEIQLVFEEINGNLLGFIDQRTEFKGSDMKFQLFFIFEISGIKDISIMDKNNDTHLNVSLFMKEGYVSRMYDPSKMTAHEAIERGEHQNRISIILDDSAIGENIHERMKEALKFLVEHEGGSLVEDEF